MTKRTGNPDNTTPCDKPKNSETAIILVVLVLAGILFALILIAIRRRQSLKPDKDNSENRLEIANERSIYSVIGDHENRISSGIASVGLYQDAEGIGVSRIGEMEIGRQNGSCNVPHGDPGPIYDEVKTQETFFAATGGDYDSMNYETVALSRPQGDIHYAMEQKPNRAQQEKPKPKQNVGADGTVYAEVNMSNGITNLYSSVRKQPKTPKCKKSLYAAIDHTLKSPPPPPK